MKPEPMNIFMYLLLDCHLHIIEVVNGNYKLVWGIEPEGLTGKSLLDLSEEVDGQNREQIGLLIDAFHRAKTEKRTVYLEYGSFLSGEEKVYAGAYIVNNDDNTFALWVTEVAQQDLQFIYSRNFREQVYGDPDPVMLPETENILSGEDCLAQGETLRDTQAMPDKYVLLFQDHTLLKQKFELAMGVADIMLWEFDAKNNIFYSENSVLTKSRENYTFTIGRFMEVLQPEDVNLVKPVIGMMKEGRDEEFEINIRILYPGEKEVRYCIINGTPYKKTANGKVVRYVGFCKNNTLLEKKKILQEKILDTIPLPVQIKDVQNGFLNVFCNRECIQMFGNLLEQKLSDILDGQQIERIRKSDLQVFRTGETYVGKERIVFKDGRDYDTVVHKSIIYDGEKRLLLTLHWDQSLQNELERRARILSISMEALKAFSWYYDPSADKLSYGEGFDKTGRDAFLVNSLEKYIRCIFPDDRQKFRDTVREILQHENGKFSLEYRMDLTGNEQYEWWESRGVLETIVRDDGPYSFVSGMNINIDSRKHNELISQEKEERLSHLIRQNELVLNNTNSGLAYIDMDYIVQWENVSICSTSLSYEAYRKGEPCYKSAHGRTSPCENCVLQRAIESQQVEQIKFCLNNKRTVEVFATPVCDERNEIEGIVIRVDDVTEREQMIEELRQAKVLAEQSDKLKSAFLANMSHEIRTPLNAIVGFSELMASSENVAEKAEFMNIIMVNNELLLKLINDILDLSKIEAGSVELKYEEFDLPEYFNGIASSMKQRITKDNVRFSVINPYVSCRVRLDKNRIAQILTNYVTNAIKYTDKGFIEMGYEQVDEGIRFYVNDSGIGISEDKKSRVFDRFEKLDEFAQGTGLGLSICKAIVESMGGSVGFQSVFGEGSQFWAVLPCDVKADPEAHNNQFPAGQDGQKGTVEEKGEACTQRKTILVAEDIHSNYMLVEALLRKHYELLHAVNGNEALEMVKNHHIDLLLMDMKMPVMDGLTATAEIRKFNTEIPIVALTAHAFEADRQAAFKNGCNDYIVKPIDKVKLMAVLRKYCRCIN